MSERKKLFIKSYGCQMNVYDAERMAGALDPEGYDTTSNVEDADLVILNTCHIREKAAEKVYSELGRIMPLKNAKPDLRIGVAGCVAQAEGAHIMERQPGVDLVVGPQAYHNLPGMVADAVKGERPINTDFPEEDKFEHLPKEHRARRAPAAFLTVQEGCDKFCAFCVVPYTRGAEVSRPVERLLAEARDLVSRGVAEVTLLGQNVNAYHGEAADGSDWSLARLVRELAEIDGLERIRYTTSHPNDMTDDLIAAHAEIDKLMPYLHLPVQSGSDAVLKGMNRRHSAQSYIELIDRIREARPDIALSGDFIVGFPGESEADFQATLDLCEKIRYSQAFSFKYSERPGTPAADRAQVDENVKAERLQRLQTMLTAHQHEFQRSMEGRTLDVLFEKPGRKPGQLIGKSPYLHAVHVFADGAQIGQIVPVRITTSRTNSLAGEISR